MFQGLKGWCIGDFLFKIWFLIKYAPTGFLNTHVTQIGHVKTSHCLSEYLVSFNLRAHCNKTQLEIHSNVALLTLRASLANSCILSSTGLIWPESAACRDSMSLSSDSWDSICFTRFSCVSNSIRHDGKSWPLLPLPSWLEIFLHQFTLSSHLHANTWSLYASWRPFFFKSIASWSSFHSEMTLLKHL